MQFAVFVTTLILVVHAHYLLGSPLFNKDDQSKPVKRSDDMLLPTGNFSLVTNEKLKRLKEVAELIDDPKLHELYRAVNHYVQIAQKNNEYVLWKYDANQEGLVLVLKQNLNGILYYG